MSQNGLSFPRVLPLPVSSDDLWLEQARHKDHDSSNRLQNLASPHSIVHNLNALRVRSLAILLIASQSPLYFVCDACSSSFDPPYKWDTSRRASNSASSQVSKEYDQGREKRTTRKTTCCKGCKATRECSRRIPSETRSKARSSSPHFSSSTFEKTYEERRGNSKASSYSRC